MQNKNLYNTLLRPSPRVVKLNYWVKKGYSFNESKYIVNSWRIKNSTVNFSTSSMLLAIDPSQGTELDSTKSIAKSCKCGKEIEKYLSEKENAIITSYRNDSNSAPSIGVPVQELSNWLDRKNDLLLSLANQKDDVYDLTGYFTDDEEVAGRAGYEYSSSDSGSDVGENISGGNVNNTNDTNNANSSNTGVSSSNEGGNSTNNFPQDSSDVVRTDYDSADYYED